MSPFFIVVISLSVIVIIVWLILRQLARSGTRMMAEEKKRIESSPRGKARVIEVLKSRTERQRGAVLVKLRLEIFPENNQESFQTTTVWEVEPATLSQISKEEKLAVKFDVLEKRRVYPLASWANYNDFSCKLWLGND